MSISNFTGFRSKNFLFAIELIKPERAFIVAPVSGSYPGGNNITITTVHGIIKELGKQGI